ncbi:PDZ domain-containing protein [Oceanobacillus piezotolerans]|uniref:endopeptidase La n=1 Tax=Oceanobacillus piezotolerans TaxID=2448030 RepID=A0A498DNB2_9BACI|nr:SepM family pheromone-processing serine protease [Oceanobacillus piezotolerans]RLL45222.1 PDZ domain-containing protein [Oceanobacillus piezotolerans]
MNFTKRNVIYLFVVIVLAYFLASYQLPYYIQRPGGADELNPIVNVENGFESKGDMHLVTVSGLQATPIQYALAKILPHSEILPLEAVFPEGISQDEYMEAQLQVMESSQEAATVVAYSAADANITIEYNGVYVVSVVQGLPAEGKLETGDRIIGIDGLEIEEANDLINYVDDKQEGDSITLTYVRDGESHTTDITLELIDDSINKAGIGISLVTDRHVTVSPEIEFSSGSIGGPSAGLMFSLEIYDQLTEKDLTNGLEIAGTGEIDYDGNVHRIGGIDKKIVAADRKGIDIFFAPNENGRKDSNYEEAKRKAEEINTDMVIIPVDTFEDALNYLEQL